MKSRFLVCYAVRRRHLRRLAVQAQTEIQWWHSTVRPAGEDQRDRQGLQRQPVQYKQVGLAAAA
ncbi:MAG: hypothetical protein M5R42_20990 [Rhodocyclaceae bacterium]|nr:hypothetical protein [Rhodocyclaceae bacterium]